MVTVLFGIEVAVSAAAYILTLVYFTHMFQLNSYKGTVQAKWMTEHIGRVMPAVCGIAIYVVGLILIWADDTTSDGVDSYIAAIPKHLMIVIAAVIIYLAGLCFIYRPRPAKKKLVFTARVIRLLITEVILTAAVALLSTVLAGIISISVMLPLLCGLVPYLLILAAQCNRPAEYAVSRHYVRDAQRILKECPDLKIIGVTGSYGKTSVKYYLHDLLSARYNVLMTPESYNTPMGVVKTIRGSLTAAHQIFICEMGARHVGDIKELCDIVHPQDGVITSIGYQHLETFRSLDNIVNTKYELFDALPQGGRKFINGDNEIIRKYNRLDGTVTYGLGGRQQLPRVRSQGKRQGKHIQRYCARRFNGGILHGPYRQA
jgi:UDP-N-acetylmuramoyl-tripeptide--D-alanyl-D-alanine ligase